MAANLLSAPLDAVGYLLFNPDKLAADVPFSSKGFSNPTSLESSDVPILDLAQLALREGQSTSPLYRVHRWFARRLGSQFRAILTALSLEPHEADRFWDTYLGRIPLEGANVLDPFVGGGTSLIEAERCGANVIGYDIDPVATFITRFELEATTFDPAGQAISTLCDSVSEQVAPFHWTSIPEVGEREVLHHFWVECRVCGSCDAPFEVHPHYRLALSKEKKRQWVFCKNCHEVAELSIDRKELRCQCGTRTKIRKGTLSRGKVQCPFCRKVSGLADRGEHPQRPQWRLFAQEYLEESPTGITRHFKRATDKDRDLYCQAQRFLADVEEVNGCLAPDRAIPRNGRSDNRPMIHGFFRYRDLFNDRQLLHLTLLGQAIKDLETLQDRQLLAMAFSEHLTTNCMYAAYAFGYRRISPMFSIHSYRHITRPVEINPWLDGIGRGTFPNVLSKIARAVEFARAPTELDPSGGRKVSHVCRPKADLSISTDPQTVLNGSSRASISTKTSEDLSAIPDDSIDLILTDPPYFDNLSYSELSDFYLAWHQSLGISESPYDNPKLIAPIEANLALTDRTDHSVEVYRTRLQHVFTECHRVLNAGGVLVFTYHHKSPKAWGALGDTLARSGFKCTKVLPLRGEGQGGLHSYSGTIKWDAVFVCRKVAPVRLSSKATTVVPIAAVEQAKHCAAAYGKDLGKNQKIGFRNPDRQNLERALIVASAVCAQTQPHVLPLSDALRPSFNRGD